MTAVHTPQSNIEIIFSDWLDALRRRDLDALAARLAPEVTHRGVRPDLYCPDRAAVLESVRATSRDLPEVEAIELVAAGDNVVLSVRAPTVGQPLDEADDPDTPRGTASIVFTLHDGLITAIQDYASRTAALRAAGAAEALWE
jgi:ABC-type phosphate/phosphonate transport system substrate-binding protein